MHHYIVVVKQQQQQKTPFTEAVSSQGKHIGGGKKKQFQKAFTIFVYNMPSKLCEQTKCAKIILLASTA